MTEKLENSTDGLKELPPDYRRAISDDLLAMNKKEGIIIYLQSFYDDLYYSYRLYPDYKKENLEPWRAEGKIFINKKDGVFAQKQEPEPKTTRKKKIEL